MISTNTIKAKLSDGPQKLKVLTTNKTKPKTEEDALAAAKFMKEKLAGLVNTRDTKKYMGPMLTTSRMADIKLNEKRKALMAKKKALKEIASFVSPTIELTPEKKTGRSKKKT